MKGTVNFPSGGVESRICDITWIPTWHQGGFALMDSISPDKSESLNMNGAGSEPAEGFTLSVTEGSLRVPTESGRLARTTFFNHTDGGRYPGNVVLTRVSALLEPIEESLSRHNDEYIRAAWQSHI